MFAMRAEDHGTNVRFHFHVCLKQLCGVIIELLDYCIMKLKALWNCDNISTRDRLTVVIPKLSSYIFKYSQVLIWITKNVFHE